MSCTLPYIQKAQLSETEKSRLEGVHLDILKEAKTSGAFRRKDNKYVTIKNAYPKATEFISQIITKYGTGVATLPPMGDGKHVLNVNVLPLAGEKQLPLLQIPGTEPKKASPQVVKLVKEFLNKAGINYEEVKDIVVNGKKLDANGIADIVQGLVQVIEGKEAEALPEEAMHFLVEIIQQTDSALFNQLLKDINKFPILQEVFSSYGNNPFYQKDGKPDIIKLKKEAIAKQLVNTIVNKVDSAGRSLWDKILQFFKNLVARTAFDSVAMKVIKGETQGDISDLRGSQEDYFLQETTQESIWNRIKEIQKTIEKKDDGYYINGRKIAKRVSDLAHTWYDNRFRDKDLLDDEYDKAVKDLKAEKGTAGHADIEYAFSLFVDENGYLRESPLDDYIYESKMTPKNIKTYKILRDNLKERLESFPKGTRFMAEAVLYDSKRDLAGTADFIAITDKGKVSILDWKFMDLNVDKYEDVPWYKINAWRIQMDQYKLLLQNVYGVKNQDFEQTRMIPIKVYYTAGNKEKNIKPWIREIKIGAVDPKKEENAYLLPVSTEAETTGNKKIDTLIGKLNSIYQKFSDKRVLPEEKEAKAEQLNSLFSAIRQLQARENIEPLIEQAHILNKQIEKTISDYESKWVGKDVNNFTQKEISAFYLDIETAVHAIQQYTDLDITLKFLVKDNPELKSKLKDVVDEARGLQSSLFELSKSFSENFIAKKEGVLNLLSAEKVIKGISRWFSSTTTLQIKALEVLYKKANRQLGFASMDTLDETLVLQNLKLEYDKLAASKFWNKRNYFDILKKKDSNELIDEFQKDFYKKLKEAIASKDGNWIRENINIDSYKKAIEERLTKELERIDDKVGITDEQKEKQKDRAIALHSTAYPDSAGWFLKDFLVKHPKAELWHSKEWKELNKPENEAALKFYNYIKKRNAYYYNIGYINGKQARVFLPFVRKGMMEKLVFGGNVSLGEQFLRSVSIDEGDVGYGKIDPLTGRPIDALPIHFTKDIDGELSTDLFRNMALYNEMAIRYSYLQDIEGQARALINVERNKKAIATSMFGKTVYKDGVIQYTPDNNDNTKLVEDMVKGIIYGQRYIQSETFDQILGSLGNFGERANKKLGMKIFPENLEGRQVSINKVITQLNNTFQLTALGLNPLSALSNLLGGTFQSSINSGKYFTKTDFMRNELNLLVNKFNGPEQKKMIAALEYFLPLTDNYNQQIAKTLSISKLSQENVQEFLMVLMRKSDLFVQTANFYAFLDNSIVQDGKIVNAREYARELPEFKDQMYVGTSDQRKSKKEAFELKVKELIEEKGVLKLGSLKDNKFDIPGIKRKDESVIELRRKVQQISKDALGNLSEDDLRAINMNIYGKSLMLFKNWIPRLVDVRFGNLKHNSASDAYEWGRMRMVFRVISEDVLHSLGNLTNALQANEKGIDFLRKLYEKKKFDYETETGKILEMSEEEFMDLVRQNIKSQLIDSLIMLSLFALFIGLKANAPDDDEDPRVKNVYTFLLRATDKVKDELRFFYDPTSFTSLVSKGIFPSVGFLNNFRTVLINFSKEMFAITTGDEKLEEKTKVIKYLMKSFPVSNQAAGMLPMFFPELAKDLGIKATSESRPIVM